MEIKPLDEKIEDVDDYFNGITDCNDNRFVWLRDIKENVQGLIEDIRQTIIENDGVQPENFDWIIKDFEKHFGKSFMKEVKE